MASKRATTTTATTLLLLLVALLLALASPALAQSNNGNGPSEGTRLALTPEQRARLSADARRAALAAASPPPPPPPAPKRQWAAVDGGSKDAGLDASPQQQRLEQQLVTSPREPAPEKPEEEAPKEEAPEAAKPTPPPVAATAAPAHAPAAAAAAPAAEPLRSPPPSAPSSSPTSIIKIDPSTLNFVDGCSTFFPSGFNIWEAVEMGFGAKQLWAASLPAGTTGPALLRAVLDSAAAANFNVMRILAHGVNKESDMSLGGDAGKFNENVAKGLDYVVAEAGKRGIRLILALTSNWGVVGSLTDFVNRAGGSGGRDPAQVFFTESAPRKLFLQHSAALANRVNSITGVRYGDDPTIFALNLINEPRCRGCGTAIGDWATAVAPSVKKEWRQLLTIGAEGFYSDSLDPQRASANPGGKGSWAGSEGQSFVRDHAAMDFLSIHMWPDNWKQPDLAFVKRWLDAHIADAAAAKKPLLLEEHGKWLKPAEGADLRARDAFYSAALDAVLSSASSGGPLKGSLLWQLMPEDPASQMPRSEGGDRGLYGLRPGDAAFKLASANAAKMRALSSSNVAGCVASASGPATSSILTRQTCVDTEVRGLPGTGLEGPNCDVEIDECSRGTHDCLGEGARCVDLSAASGGWACECLYGYEPVAVAEKNQPARCSPTPALAELSTKRYAVGANGTIACSGSLLPWPLKAAGGGRDPAVAVAPAADAAAAAAEGETGASSSRVEPWVAVSLTECLQACEIANEEAASAAAAATKKSSASSSSSSSLLACEAAEFNAVRGRCRLRGAGARAGGLCRSQRETHVEANQSLVEKEYDEGAFEAFFRKA